MAIESKTGKRKRWIKILASKSFGNMQIGESLANDASELVGRNICVSLSSLMSDMKRQGFRVTFKVKEIKNNEGMTDIVSYEMLSAHIKRIMRRGVNKIDDSFVVECKDSKARIKPLLLTRGKAQRGVLSNIRKNVRDYLTGELKKYDFENAIFMVVSYKLQKGMRQRINKIYPVGNCEIRAIKKM